MEELLEKTLLVEKDWGRTLATAAATGIVGGAAMLGGTAKVASEKPVEKPAVVKQVEQSAIKIDMQRIASIESSNNPKAENTQTGARGLTQIMQPTWKEMVAKMGEDWSWDDALDGEKNLAVGSYYMNTEIPRLLKHYGIEDTIENRLAAYNWGIGNLKNVGIEKAPQETIEYIEKYND